MAQTLPRRLLRSRPDRMVAGVGGGLAAYFDVDPTIVRLLWVVAGVLSGGAVLLVYLAMAIIVPEEPTSAQPRTSIPPEEAEGAAAPPEPTGTGEPGTDLVAADLAWADDAPERDRRRNWAGIILILLGLLFLAGNLGLYRWLRWDVLWPMVLIAAGVLVLWKRWRS